MIQKLFGGLFFFWKSLCPPLGQLRAVRQEAPGLSHTGKPPGPVLSGRAECLPPATSSEAKAPEGHKAPPDLNLNRDHSALWTKDGSQAALETEVGVILESHNGAADRGHPPSNTPTGAAPQASWAQGCQAGRAWAHPQTIPTVTEQIAPPPPRLVLGGHGQHRTGGPIIPRPVHTSAQGPLGPAGMVDSHQWSKEERHQPDTRTRGHASCSRGAAERGVGWGLHIEADSRHTLDSGHSLRPHNRHGHHRTHVTLHRAHAPRTRGAQAWWAGAEGPCVHLPLTGSGRR